MPRDDDDEPLAHPHEPRVRAVSKAVLLDNKWPPHEIDEGVDEGELRAWASSPHPTTLGGWKALCRTIAGNMAIDRIRSDEAGGKKSERPTDRADERLAPNNAETMEARIDRQRAIREMRAAVAPKDLPVFDLWALGHQNNEIGAKLDMHPREVSRRVTSMRERFQKMLGPAAIVALLAVVAGYFVFRDRLGPDDQAHHEQQPSATATTPPGPSPEELAQQQQQNKSQADSLRQLAAADCLAGNWDDCSSKLQSAGKLDPQGNEQRSVKRLRAEARRGVTQDAVESKGAPAVRQLYPELKAAFLKDLAPASGQALRLDCAATAEPAQLCAAVAGAMKTAGLKATRGRLQPTDAGLVHGIVIEVATDADESTQNAADALANAFGHALLRVRGPRDAAPGGDAPLRVIIGPQ
jgi:DNA-directed RNA polymerase specialized sigma24 family protein